jgi:hypothetical protein
MEAIMNFTTISHPKFTAADDVFVIRNIMRDSKLKKLPIEKITLPTENPFGSYEDFMLNDLIENVRLNGAANRPRGNFIRKGGR